LYSLLDVIVDYSGRLKGLGLAECMGVVGNTYKI